MKKAVLLAIVVLLLVVLGLLLSIVYLFYPLKYRTEIVTAGKTYHLEPALLAAVIKVESGFGATKVSPKGAVGLMQIMPATAAYLGAGDTDLTDPTRNIDLGARYLRYLLDKFHDQNTALFAYNAGEGRVQAWLNAAGASTLTTCPYPETNAYVKDVNRAVKFYWWRF